MKYVSKEVFLHPSILQIDGRKYLLKKIISAPAPGLIPQHRLEMRNKRHYINKFFSLQLPLFLLDLIILD